MKFQEFIDAYNTFATENGFVAPELRTQEFRPFKPKTINARARALQKHNRQITKASRRTNRGL